MFILEDKDPDVHHIDYDKANCAKENLITLCEVCHGRTNYNRDYWKNILTELYV
jgi:hypothetical protein